MELNLRQDQLGAKRRAVKIRDRSKITCAWTGGKQKLMDKGRISKNKKFQNFKSEKKIKCQMHL